VLDNDTPDDLTALSLCRILPAFGDIKVDGIEGDS
jgi:hypothetical protein